LYEKQGGLKDIFIHQEPNLTQIAAINSYIAKNIENLKNEGMIGEKGTICLTDGVDCVSYEEFDPDEQVEWCLLRSGDNNFKLIKKTTAENLINKGSNHPFIRGPLTENDIVRGEAMLVLIG
jgi:hypothetical protein